MRIEEAIKQKKPFDNAKGRAQVNLIYTHNWLVHRIKQDLKPYGLTMNQFNVLRILRGAGEPITTSVIRERLLDKMADASRLVDRLHQKGWVLRKVCPTDKRLVDVSLSEEGHQLLTELDAVRERMTTHFNNLTEKEAEQLNDLLDKVRSR